jgi:hypothetical protein
VTTIGRTAWGTHQLYSGFVGDSTVRLLLASNMNDLIEGSEGAILRLSLTAGTDFEGGDIVFRRMLCTSPDLTEARPATFTLHLNGTTGIGDNKRVTINSTRDVYDLQGRRVSEFGIRNSELKNGISIIGGRKVIK